jgi:arylsulfatase A-like enzyme
MRATNEGTLRREFLRVLGTAVGIGSAMAMLPRGWAAPATQSAPRPAGKRPNILIIMADDHSAKAVSAYGSKVNRTPHIDRLYNEGARFDHCLCVNSLCVPSRASILTGKYGHKNGVPGYFNRLDPRQVTFPMLLQRSGYHTGIIGKWHLSVDDIKNPPRGFDYWCVLPGLGDYNDPDMFDMGVRKKFPGYVTEIITDRSIDFIRQRDRDKPFLLFCTHKAPHQIWEPDEAHAHLYDEVRFPEPENMLDDHATKPQAVKGKKRTLLQLARTFAAKHYPTGSLDTRGMDENAVKQAVFQKYIRDYLGCVAALDDSVGRLLKTLEDEGILEDTLVVYTSDQGEMLGYHGWYEKRMFYEESIQMPLLVRYPAEIRPRTVVDRMALNIDFAATFLDYAAVPIPSDLQGQSLRPLLQGKTVPAWRKSMFYLYYHEDMEPKNYGVRTERYKLIHYPYKNEWELLDLGKDPLENTNVYHDPAYADVVKQMKAELARLVKELEVPADDLKPVPPKASKEDRVSPERRTNRNTIRGQPRPR